MSARSLSTPFSERFGLRVPLVQAPMVGAGTAAMAAAASNAGALGSLGAGAFTPDRLETEVAAIRAATARPFAVNLFVLPDAAAPDAATVARALAAIDPLNAALGLPPGTAPARYAPDFRAQLDTLVALRVPVASFTFGVLDAADVARLKAAGTYVIGTATHVAEGLAWRDAGADAISAQGAEAGGHRGTFIGAAEDALIGTLALVPQLVDATGLPVLAAGGIMDGRGIAAALALGAQAAQLGTAFLACAESAIAADWKARVVASTDTSTQVTRAITGRHARGLRNTLMTRLGERAADVAPYPVQNALTQPLRQAAARANDGDYLSLWAGQGAPLTRRRAASLTTSQLVDALDTEWRAAAA
ncbi:nitronate monooxygenase [Burkholderia sp. AU19243]|uniref:Nitronate monooxygenase n=1 Tax=Burkholderia latens TaxID=488446 RepID=A0AAP1C262_9BURK|nr:MULTISPECIES: nitronate monooxygenase [Burkholderia]MBR8146388.1 nitronate monooxygenase [Burkholderia vietnamiensis]KVA00734.1 nitronate monooxygenase [Burkholderia latens]MBR8367251.1 nitronate monooxygenase [Burkholderia sp. AU19243]MBY4698086.1 nitronate monooxygenase [Burkholderia latens]QTO48752.1 nitronate monooxygenase [Burkholderia latens]